MRVVFVSRGELTSQVDALEGLQAELIIASFRTIGEVSYERELRGQSRYFEALAELSLRTGAAVVCGCITDTKGFKRKSAIVADGGRVLGVSDMLNSVDGEMNSGAALRVYETSVGKIGVAVAEDLCFPEIAKSLTLCGSDVIVCPYGRVESSVESVLARALAFCYGVPVCLCGVGYSAVGGTDGELAFASAESPILAEIERTKEYHLVETRQRGLYRPPRKMY